MTYVFDIDGTICSLTEGNYLDAEPFLDRIDLINKLYDDGNQIILFTARGMGRTNNCAKSANLLFKDLTMAQLKNWGVKFTSLYLGKPSGDIYIDDKGTSDEEFFKK